MPELPSWDGSVRRPGAMTMVMSATPPRSAGPRWLRCALVRDGRVVWADVRSPDPDLGGRLTLAMDVMPVGATSSAHIEDDTAGSPRLADCAVRAVSSVRVSPGPTAPVEVRYFSSERRQR